MSDKYLDYLSSCDLINKYLARVLAGVVWYKYSSTVVVQYLILSRTVSLLAQAAEDQLVEAGGVPAARHLQVSTAFILSKALYLAGSWPPVPPAKPRP